MRANLRIISPIDEVLICDFLTENERAAAVGQRHFDGAASGEWKVQRFSETRWESSGEMSLSIYAFIVTQKLKPGSNLDTYLTLAVVGRGIQPLIVQIAGDRRRSKSS